MIDWTYPKQGIFRKVLIEIYRSNLELRQFVRDHFEQSLDSVPALDVGKTVWAGALLEESVAGGWIDDLYQKFCSEHLADSRVIQLKRDLKDPSLEASIGDATSDRFVMRVTPDEPLVEDPTSTHLVIAVFWKERNEKLLRIAPKLCYQDPKNGDILPIYFSQDDYSIPLKKFPEFIKSFLLNYIYPTLANLFKNSIEPWTLTVELFVPVDLLCQPLSTWCGPDQELACDHSIVVGCSDRFNRDRPGEAANLHNELKTGWKRFKDEAPDIRSSNLRNLSWLRSDIAHRETLRNYSAFRCYGHWLKTDEKLLKNWIDLVKSGIPLALWMCEGTLSQPEIVDILGDLIDCTRFEFLQRIRRTRDQLQKICDHDIGIFYEDPTYVPDVPLPPEVQFLGFPGL